MSLRGQGIRFVIATGISATVTLALPIALHEGIGVSETRAVAVALLLAFFMNFFLTRFFVYRSRGTPGTEFLKYAAFSGVMRGAEYAIFLGLFLVLGAAYYIALFLSLLISWFAKFFILRNFVFSPQINPGARAG